MRAAILAIGSELLSTDRTDSNSLRLAESLERFGVQLVVKQVVGDDVERIARSVGELRSQAELLLVTGGLGPTADDVTRTAVAQATGRALTEDDSIVADIERKFASFGRQMPAVNRRQAEVPEGARVIDNPRGTAPGLRLDLADTTIFLFPGVPRELEAMIESALDPWLAERVGGQAEHRLTLRVACLAESEVEELLAPAYEEHGAIGVLASPGDIRVGLRAADAETLSRMERTVRACLGSAVYASGAVELEDVVGQLLLQAGLRFATAESCTGGWIAQRLTAVPGSSAYFLGGVVAYADRVKVEQLGVAATLLAAHGAVSRPVVEAMAVGVNERLGSDLSVAVSGIAGPDGGTPEKPVGTVDVALAHRAGGTVYRRLQLPGNRRIVRLLTTQWALDLVRRELSGGLAR